MVKWVFGFGTKFLKKIFLVPPVCEYIRGAIVILSLLVVLLVKQEDVFGGDDMSQVARPAY